MTISKIRKEENLVRHSVVCLIAILILSAPGILLAQADPALDSAAVADTVFVPVAPVTTLVASDFKYDDGESVELSWVPSIDDVPEVGRVTGYKLFRSTNHREYQLLSDLPVGSNYFKDDRVHKDSVYTYYVLALAESGSTQSTTTQEIIPEREWLNFDLGYLFLIALIVGAAVIFFIETAKRGKKLFVRKIAGLEAVDEAIGRATEMGRPILFIPGIHDMDDVQTLAAITILGRVARTVADYDTKIRMPVARSLVMTAARETIKSSYMTAGRPDAYSDDMVNYVTDEQFGYVAAVDGIMVREKPATIFLLGAFFAESLILAETGNSVGAIQIAGTARPAQLPFFIAACDFTLIGEELFAASAYLSNEPKSLGSLKGQDVGKAIAMVAVILGALAATMATAWQIGFMQDLLTALNRLFSS